MVSNFFNIGLGFGEWSSKSSKMENFKEKETDQ